MGDDSNAVTVADNPAQNRYEARVGGHLAVVTYALESGRIIFLHTEVPPELEGHGIAGVMVRFALEDARARGLAVIPRCPYVRAYIRRHPEYANLLPAGQRQRWLG
jgi:uncharacterized protein